MIDDYMARIISHLDDSRANFTDWASDFLANDLRRLFSDINGSKTPVADDVLINFSMLTLLIGNKILKDHGLNNVNWHISNLGGYMLSQGIVGIAWLLLKHYPADLMLNAHAMTIKLLLDFNKKDLAACLARSLYKDLNYSMDYLRSYFGIYLY